MWLMLKMILMIWLKLSDDIDDVFDKVDDDMVDTRR